METSTEVSAEAIRTQLDRILASPGFVHSDRMARFLRFTVEQTLKGHASELKETVLGMEVFDRPSSFDPRTDTIVRVEARRLRSKLKEYYEGEGRGDSVQIDFPKGSYVPTFLLANGRCTALNTITSPEADADGGAVKGQERRLKTAGPGRKTALLVAAVLVIATLVGLLLFRRGERIAPEIESLAVLPLRTFQGILNRTILRKE